MKLLVIGDSHGNIANLKHVMGFAKHIKCKAVIHTGDWNNIKSLETVPNNEEIANISAKINPNDTNDISNLRVIWSYCSERMSLDDLIKVALVLLSSNMIASESETDFATGLWIELCGDNQVEILEYLITNSALNDEQLHRTWQQILSPWGLPSVQCFQPSSLLSKQFLSKKKFLIPLNIWCYSKSRVNAKTQWFNRIWLRKWERINP